MRVYFYACEERDNYQNDLVQLAEGLEELGVEMHSRRDYWQKTPKEGDYLLRRSDAKPEDCDVVVVPYRWFRWIKIGDPQVRSRQMPSEIKVPRSKRKYVTVYLDDNDGYATPALDPEFSAFDLVLRTKFNRRTWNPPNFRPWAIGLERRVIAATDHAPSFAARRPAIYVNYNASHPFMHSSRKRAIEELHPKLKGLLDTYQPPFAELDEPPLEAQARLWWEQTNKRHSSEYYERLKTSQACSAFCGELLPPLPYAPRIFEVFGNKAELQKRFWKLLGAVDPRPDRIISWDSFRFWETLAAGSVAFHVDLEKHGIVLPVMPENWRHYIGVDFQNLDRDVSRLKQSPSMLEDIACAGREWALTNYSPKAVAARFLSVAAQSLIQT
jgi:hypothetical protein